MKYLVLFALVACSAPVEKPAPETSEYNPGNCLCMKIFRPVCGADGQTYGNSCEAECQKVSWTDGACR